MDSELPLKFIGYFANAFLDNLCRHSVYDVINVPCPRARNKGSISRIPEGQVNMLIFQLMRFFNANKIFVLSSIAFHVHDELQIRYSTCRQWGLHVMASGGKHVEN